MKFLSLLGAAVDASGDVGGNTSKVSYAGGGGIFKKALESTYFQNSDHKWLGQIVAFLGNILIPITIVILAAAVIWCVYLGIQLARAEDAGKAGEVKKRLINVAVAFLVTLVAIWIIALLMAYVPTWLSKNYVSDPETTTTMIETVIHSFTPKL